MKPADDHERQEIILKALNAGKRRLSEEKKRAVMDAMFRLGLEIGVTVGISKI